MKVSHGLAPSLVGQAAALYWEAFGPKLQRTLGPDDKALAFIEGVMRPDHAIAACDDAGQLIGVLGFKTREGAFVDGTLGDMRGVYGAMSGTVRGLLLHLLERDVDNRNFLLDGVCVAAAARGQGVGTRLLDAACVLAAERGYESVRLDVIDANTKARALYERLGFQAQGDAQMGPLRHVFGFAASTKMVKPLSRGPC